MAKYQRKRRHNKRIPQKRTAPPLSKLDKGIYVVLILLSVVLVFSPLFVTWLFQDHVAHADPSVVYSAPRGWAGLWIILSFFFVGCPLAALFLEALMNRQPFFGRDDVIYGAAGGREEIYPMFGEHRRSAVADKPFTLKSGRVLIAVVAIALSALLSVLSLFGRTDLHKDLSVTVKNSFNVEIQHYSVDEIEAVTFALVHSRHHGRRYNAMVILTMEDGREYGMAAEPSVLLWVKKELHDRIPVDYRMDIGVDKYIKKAWLSETDAAMIREVFSKS